MSYVFYQCRNQDCRFRYPVWLEAGQMPRCPRCRGEVFAAGQTVSPVHLPSLLPAGSRWVALLDNIRSIHNTGSMFRTADGAGLAHLYLCGMTATPDHPRLDKAALGAQHTVAWSYCPNAVDAATALRREGYRLWALERLSPADHPSLLTAHDPHDRLALIVGNEKAGVDPGLLALCDRIFSLPMVGQKGSLNAAVAFGIAVYHLRFGLRVPASAPTGGNHD